MNQLKELINLDRNSGIPLYLQLANGLMYAIRRGHLRRGLKLPGSRKMADLFTIQRNTVLAAQDELLAQGWIVIKPQKGAFVAENLPEVRPARIKEDNTVKQYAVESAYTFRAQSAFDVYIHRPSRPAKFSINDGFPDARLAPAEELARELRSIARIPSYRKLLGYAAPEGAPELRSVLTDFLRDTRGLPITAENILITRGAQMGIYMASRLLLQPGDRVVVGSPGYFAATKTFEQMGANVNRVPVDDAGIDVARIEKLCKKERIRLVYVIPHHHHPTTVTLSPERRMKLLELAAQYGFGIIEDDYDYDFHYANNPVLPLASLDYQGHVLYVGTLTKTLVPAVRLGFVVAPENVISSLANIRRSIDWQGDTMTELAIAQLYKDGTISRHIKKAVKLYHQRRDHFCALLQQKAGEYIHFKIPDGGMSVWACFQGVRLKEVAARAAYRGLSISNGSTFNDVVDYNACRMGFASLNEREQKQAIDILVQSL